MPVVEPAQFGEAVVSLFARKVIECVAQEVHVAALPIRFGQGLHDGALEARVIVAGGQAHAVQAALLQAHEMVFPTAGALAVGQLD